MQLTQEKKRPKGRSLCWVTWVPSLSAPLRWCCLTNTMIGCVCVWVRCKQTCYALSKQAFNCCFLCLLVFGGVVCGMLWTPHRTIEGLLQDRILQMSERHRKKGRREKEKGTSTHHYRPLLCPLFHPQPTGRKLVPLFQSAEKQTKES